MENLSTEEAKYMQFWLLEQSKAKQTIVFEVTHYSLYLQ